MTSTDEHKAAMLALQQEQKAKVAAAEHIDRGLVLVHTGNGKGKSSSAFGVIARALGWGQKVAVVQFIKGNWKTGEREFFKRFPDELHWHTMGDGFTWNTQDKEQDTKAAVAGFAKATELMVSGAYDLVVLDELNIALRYEYLGIDVVIDTIAGRSQRTSVIATGRDAHPKLIELADLVSEMQEIKHPFKAGIKAKQGIDY